MLPHRSSFLAFVLSAMCAGCAAAVGYTPTATMSQADAMAVIARTLEDQPGVYEAMNVEVSQERLSFRKQRGRLVFNRSPAVITFDFDSLGNMAMARKRNRYVVSVWDTRGALRLAIVILDPAWAKRFMDAMTSMARVKP